MTTAPAKRDHSTLIIIISAIGVAVFVLGMMGYGAYMLLDEDVVPPSALVLDTPTLAAGDTPAALVNGVPIGMQTVEERRPLIQIFQVQDVDPEDTREVVEWLVEQELIRQEAARRKIGPTDEEITTYIQGDQRAFAELREQGALAPGIAAVIDEQAAQGHPLETWHEDPVFRAAYRDLLLAGYLSRDSGGAGITSDLGEYDRMVTALRANSIVEILVD